MQKIVVDPDIPRIFHDEIIYEIKNLLKNHRSKLKIEKYTTIKISDGSTIEIMADETRILASQKI